jgi:hypothetical protein
MSALPLVMKRLTPLIRHFPVASSRMARHWTEPRSEPASGSVSTMAPKTSPREKRGRMRAFISSSANSLIVEAISWSPKMVIRPPSARETISIMAW